MLGFTDFPLHKPVALCDASTLTHFAFSETEIQTKYWPIALLLAEQVNCHRARCQQLAAHNPNLCVTPFLLGLTGSVSVGKSSLAALLTALLQQALPALRIQSLSTDGFLKTTAILEAEGLMQRKGFPESYDQALLAETFLLLKQGQDAKVPIYSHATYDILPDEVVQLDAPDVVIFEGLNLLPNDYSESALGLDYLLLLDAKTQHIQQWYIDRFLWHCECAEKDPNSFYVQFLDMYHEQRVHFAERVWQQINLLNYEQHIAPYKQQADMLLTKASDHTLQSVQMRRV